VSGPRSFTTHICRTQLQQRSPLPLIDALEATARRLRGRRLRRIALFGTSFTIDSRLFGALEASATGRALQQIGRATRWWRSNAVRSRASPPRDREPAEGTAKPRAPRS
jgi:hypothetical protein